MSTAIETVPASSQFGLKGFEASDDQPAVIDCHEDGGAQSVLGDVKGARESAGKSLKDIMNYEPEIAYRKYKRSQVKPQGTVSMAEWEGQPDEETFA